MLKKFIAGLAVLTNLTTPFVANAAATQTNVVQPHLGDWNLSDGRLTIKVTNCQGNRVCANLIRLQEPNNADGTPKLDLKNKNPALRSRKLIGMPLIDGMVPSGPNTWRGQIYSSDDGDFYRGYATLSGDKLDVQGCWFVICRTLNFVRAK